MQKIIISKNGPYLVSGNIPLGELIITPGPDTNEYVKGRTFKVKESYSLCRCGHSKNMPFCDGSHIKSHFDGTLTATTEPVAKHAKKYYGTNLILQDNEKLCAYARFCHTKNSDAWALTEDALTKDDEALAIKLVANCPSGRLVMINSKNNEVLEPHIKPSIMLLQDPARDCSGPLWVRGGIHIEDDKGHVYEKRNRVTLCRCGGSNNKPFCDTSHIRLIYQDNSFKE